jgi:CubicO group peptidase (beta-lactamase class C family)
MKDTTFWPNEEQLKRLAKAYKPNADKSGLEETPITQLSYPLNDRKRQPVPAGGLFSTAADISKFCRMLLSGGTLEGKRYLSEAAIEQMTTKQTGPLVKDGYGFGLSAKDATGTYGHAGAYKTWMGVDTQKQIAMVFLIQNNGFRDEELGKTLKPAFLEAARELAKP